MIRQLLRLSGLSSIRAFLFGGLAGAAAVLWLRPTTPPPAQTRVE